MLHRQRLWNPLFLDPNTPPNPGFIPSISDEELQAKVRKIIAKNDNDPTEAVGLLLKDNAEIREKNRQANAKLSELGTPKKGVVVLEGDEAKAYEALKTKGVDISKVQTIIEEHGTLKQFKSEIETNTINQKAAQALGWNKDVLVDQINLRKLHVEMKDETIKEGDKTTVRSMPYVRPADNDKAPLEALGSYAEKNFPKPYLQLLKETKGEEQEVGEETGVEFLHQSPSEQGSGGSNKKKDPAKSYIDANYSNKLPFEAAETK